MAYIEPNSEIVLFQNVLIDSAYENTIYFANRSAQEAYFFNNSKILLHLTRHSYNRTRRGSVKIKAPVSTVMRSTYMAFKNTSYENKWFYCFIDDFNYINDNTVEVFYTIDLVQTYFIGDCSLQQCYVEREHDPDDIVGQNRVPEPVGSDNIRYTLKWECAEMGEYSVIISASALSVSQGQDLYFLQGMFNGLDVKVEPMVDSTDADHVMLLLNDMLGDGNYVDPSQGATRQQVVSVIMFPSAFALEATQTATPKPKKYIEGFQKTRSEVSGYVPKNNKLFTAPYKSLLLTNGIGSAITLDYDDFTVGDYVNFKLWGVASGSGEVVCVPQWYKGIEDNLDFKLVINGFPPCAYTLDSYRAWIAGGGDKYAKMGLVQGIADGIKSYLGFKWADLNAGTPFTTERTNWDYTQSGMLNGEEPISRKATTGSTQTTWRNKGVGVGEHAIANATGGIANSVITYMETQYEQGNRVNVPAGENSASCLVASRDLNFRCYELNIIAEDAERIDNFFSMYGYATKKLKVPNISARPQWNYVKTQGCVIAVR